VTTVVVSVKPGGLEHHESPLVLANGLSCILGKDTLLKREQTVSSAHGASVEYVAATGAVWRKLKTFTLDETTCDGLKVCHLFSALVLLFLPPSLTCFACSAKGGVGPGGTEERDRRRKERCKTLQVFFFFI